MPDTLSVGRTNENDIVLASPYLSSRHAEITLKDRQAMLFHIKDLGSTNGTFKNGARINESEFTLSDQIRFGNYELQPTDFLDYFLEDKVSTVRAKPAGGSIWTKITLVFFLATTLLFGYLLVTGTSIDKNYEVDGSSIIQVVALFLLSLITIQIVQSFLRYSSQLQSEKQFRSIMLERWQQKTQTLLDAHESKDKDENEGWQGFRKFEVAQKVNECPGITSFYLKPHDSLKLPTFKPGQYLTFKLKIPGQTKSVIRCYSLSDSYHDDYYRVSIKKVPPPPKQPELPWGLSSSYFHEQLEQGAILDVKAPSGKFFLELNRDTGVVLIAGGVGLTPMVSMLNSMIERGSKRDIWFFYGVRNGDELAMKAHLKALAEEHDNVHVQLCFSDPVESDKAGEDYDVHGRVGIDLFKEKLPSSNYEYYLCGPPPMMNAVAEGLREWGVPEDDIYAEAFGPASIKSKKKNTGATPAASAEVTFSRSGKTCEWQGDEEKSLLELAEDNDIELEYGCRAGNCGTCMVAIREGKVRYLSEHDVDVEEGSCLACISAPDGNLKIDA